MTEEEQVSAKAKHKAEQQKYRQGMTEEEQVGAKAKNKAEQQKHRQGMAEEEQVVAKAKNKAEQRKSRKSRKKVERKEGLRTDEILAGIHPVPDLGDTPDSIGNMDIVCNNCGAFKFRKETGSTCCSNGKVMLDANL